MRTWVLGLLVSLPVLAAPPDGGVEEFSLPSFGPPPMPPSQLETEPEAQPGSSPAMPDVPPVAPPVVANPVLTPTGPTWSRLGAMATAVVTGSDSLFVGGDLALLVTLLGRPSPSDAVPGEVEGWVLQTGLVGGYGRVMRTQCRGSFLCGTRGYGGLALKGGWARGVPAVRDGVARLQTMYFGQLETLLSRFDIASAPLSPGVRTWELLLRLRLGLHLTLDSSRVSSTGVTFTGAVVIEGIPVSTGTQGIAFGGSVGVGF